MNDGDSIIRLVGAVLAAQLDEWAEQRRDVLARARCVGEPQPDDDAVLEPDYRALTA